MIDPSEHGRTFADTDADPGPAPSNDVEVDEDADEAPNVERPCEGEVSDD